MGYKIDQKEYNVVNVELNQKAYCLYKTCLMNERRSYNIDILNVLYYDLNVIQSYYTNKMTSSRFLNEFVKCISNIIHV